MAAFSRTSRPTGQLLISARMTPSATSLGHPARRSLAELLPPWRSPDHLERRHPAARHGRQRHRHRTGAARDPHRSPMLALAPGHAPGTGAGTGHDVPPPPARRLDAAASAFDRARDGWLITRTCPGPPYRRRSRPARGHVPRLHDPAGRLRRLAVTSGPPPPAPAPSCCAATSATSTRATGEVTAHDPHRSACRTG